MKKILNTSKRTYMHTIIEEGNPVQYRAEPNQIVSVPDEVAALWLRSPEIQAVDSGLEEKDAEIALLKKELEEAKKKEETNPELESLKEEAKKLGVKGFATFKNIDSLKAKIEEAKIAKETEKVEEKEETTETESTLEEVA